MCRWDDGDYDWYVDSETKEIAERHTQCEDCGRLIAAGEHLIRFMAVPPEEDERPLVLVVAVPPKRWFSDGDRWVTIVDEERCDTSEACDRIIGAFESLGFHVDEVPDPRLPPDPPCHPDSFSCVQCRAADLWLREVCRQHEVLVAANDIIEHTRDYTADELGPDFMTLAALARQQWRTKDRGNLIAEPVIKRLARNAVQHAVVTGLHPE